MKVAINGTKLMLKSKFNYANAVTMLNLSMGCLSLLYVLKNKPFLAGIFILIGTLLDRFDGRLARKSGMVSDLGKQLDSLADLVSFGVAPAILLWSLSLREIPIYGDSIAIIFILSGAYRLAKYNISEHEGFYIGVPITAAGGLVAIIASMSATKYYPNPYLLASLSLLLSYAMVTTNIKIKKR